MTKYNKVLDDLKVWLQELEEDGFNVPAGEVLDRIDGLEAYYE